MGIKMEMWVRLESVPTLALLKKKRIPFIDSDRILRQVSEVSLRFCSVFGCFVLIHSHNCGFFTHFVLEISLSFSRFPSAKFIHCLLLVENVGPFFLSFV
ncbi:hypothetical protein HS088_TW13G00475 [Tripterygium wilfordii]|uniref:Uncharacterized protein n=1 Tax=Tripterygium wilfordii TaxID=458696 RepID=A0A7J7CU30_TRIWF|nr:hypothetical protein HS088_TW13G00475 [Tripterygium wilfordii]